MKMRLIAMLAGALALVGCEQAQMDANLEKAKEFAHQASQVIEEVCHVVPKGAALINAVTGMEPTTVALTTVATTFCVAVFAPSSVSTFADTCPGGVTIKGVCVPYEKKD